MTYRKLLAAASATVMITTLALGLDASGSATDKYEVIYSFNGLEGGVGPLGLISDAAGNLYGTTEFTFTNGGVVFKLSHDASGRWSETVLHTFQGKDGANPASGLTFDKARNLYGTTQTGGPYGGGTVFKLTPEPDGTWSETVLHSFQGKDGANPNGELVIDRAGNLYGTTSGGGIYNSGLVFKLAPATNGEWLETVLHDFQGTDGAIPGAGLIFDQARNLYGTTYHGGAHNKGTVFKLSPDADGQWTETVLHSFQGPPDGANPAAGLIFDRAGNLYGTTVTGGAAIFLGNGVVFKLSHDAAGAWAETVLHTFQVTGNPPNQAPGGAAPRAHLTFDRAGNLYGTAAAGGSVGAVGVVFKLSPEPNGKWIESVLHDFKGAPTDGAGPRGALIIDAAGNLYGTTVSGGSGACGAFSCGAVFQITP